MPTVLNQLMGEQNQNLINALFGAFVVAQQTYLPPESVPKFNKETCNFFMSKAKREKDNEGLSRFCIEKALSFATDKANLELLATWIQNKAIEIEGEKLPFTLSADQGYRICKLYWASSDFNDDQKKELLSKALEGDNSDKAANVRKVCEWSLPKAELKQQLWEEITNPLTNDSLMELRMKI